MYISLRKIVILSILFLNFLSLLSQGLSKKELVRTVQLANILFYYDKNYEKAALAYESLLKIYPGNPNFSAKLGICYLNIDGKKSEALRLLELASKDVVLNEHDYYEYGEQAPLDTYIYLAVAYSKNDSIQKALSLFTEAKRKLGSTGIFKEDYIDLQIRNCHYALEMKKKPLTIISNLFTTWLNEYPGACNPALAKNDSVFVFTEKINEKTRILCSYKSGNIWERPGISLSN